MQLNHNALLMGAFGTTEAELQQMRDGKLPEKQHKRLWKHASKRYIWMIVAMLSIVFFTGVFVPSQVIRWGILISFLCLFFWQFSKTLTDSLLSRVYRISGYLQRLPPAQRAPSSVMIDGQKFMLTEEQCAAFQPLQAYTLYYAPTTRQVFAAELYYDEKPKNDDAQSVWH